MNIIKAMQAAAEAFLANPSLANEQAVRDTSRAYGMSARMVDQRVQGLRQRAAKVVTVSEPCVRCGGTGQYMDFGTCFRCEGSGEEPK